MESLLIAPVHLAQPHALPFRTIFEEHRLRKEPSLERAATMVFEPATGVTPLARLADAIHDQEEAYAELRQASLDIAQGVRTTTLDPLLDRCKETDRPLKQVLHLMDANALSLSGGGIRSASISLGVLEGLARFSRPDSGHLPEKPIMDNLDYLSTVSGGGYIGSWMMSWIYRRKEAAAPFSDLRDAHDVLKLIHRAEENLHIAQALCLGAQQALPALPDRSTSAFLSRQLKELSATCVQTIESVTAAATAAAALPPGPQLDPLRQFAVRVQTAVCAPMQTAQATLAPYLATKTLDPIALKAALLLASQTLSETTLALASLSPPPDWKTAYSEVIGALAGKSSVTSGDPSPRTIRHLRAYTSFLAPALGLTLDTFTLAAIVLRNIYVNWNMLLPVIFSAIALVESNGYFVIAAQHWVTLHPSGKVNDGIDLAVALFFFFAAITAAFALPSHYRKLRSTTLRSVAPYFFVVPVVLGSWLLVVSWHLPAQGMQPQNYFLTYFLIGAFDFAFVGISIALAYKDRVAGRHPGIWRSVPAAWVMGTAAVAAAAAATSGLLMLLRIKVFPYLLNAHITAFASSDRRYILFALPLVLMVLLTTASLLCALLGVYEMEEDREWWVRSGGCLLAIILAWIAAHALAFYGYQWWSITMGVLAVTLGGGASLLSASSSTAAAPGAIKSSQLSGLGKFLQKYNLVLPAIGTAALGLIALNAVAAEERMRIALLHSLKPHLATGTNTGNLPSALALFLAFAVLTFLINFAININLFSLHGMYRMRLMRAFLGASNVFRRPDPFTKFDPRDTPHETDMPCSPGVPMHLINTTLNLTGTKDSAWAQRKAECFTFSPIHAGSWRLGYVPAGIYGGSRGVSLATAMSISGAAFNPNMGYQSSPMLSLLMTFFNVRLGCWLPNPKQTTPTGNLPGRGIAFFSKSGPSFALKPLLSEALGLADDTSNWIELTDGGHFEDLALYEMVMRRVKRIVIVDAGADPKCQFEDLGNAIRKIYIDLGVPIRFAPDLKMKPGIDEKNSYCAVATIDYGCVDQDCADQHCPGEKLAGQLVYIKAGLKGDEPADILQYAKTHPTFPHETTANQFFNESQFESYRHLGSHIIETITAPYIDRKDPNQFDTFIEAAKAHWSGPAAPSPPAPCKLDAWSQKLLDVLVPSSPKAPPA